MRKSLGLVLAILLIVILVLAVWVNLRPPEPVYKGKPISFWIERPDVPQDEFFAFPDFPKLDSRAIPYLLLASRRKEGPLDGFYRWAWAETPNFMERHSRGPRNINVLQVRLNAVRALASVGTNSQAAIADLMWIAKNDGAAIVRMHAVEALQEIGQGNGPAKQVVIDALKDSAPEVRDAASDALWQLDPDTARTLLKK